MFIDFIKKLSLHSCNKIFLSYSVLLVQYTAAFNLLIFYFKFCIYIHNWNLHTLINIGIKVILIL